MELGRNRVVTVKWSNDRAAASSIHRPPSHRTAEQLPALTERSHFCFRLGA